MNQNLKNSGILIQNETQHYKLKTKWMPKVYFDQYNRAFEQEEPKEKNIPDLSAN